LLYSEELAPTKSCCANFCRLLMQISPLAVVILFLKINSTHNSSHQFYPCLHGAAYSAMYNRFI